MRFLLFFCFAILFPAALPGQQNPLVTNVAPDYGDDAKLPMVTLPIVVDFVVYPNGKPYSMASRDDGISHNEVLALSKYEFVKSKEVMIYTMTVPLKRTIAEYEVPEHVFSQPPVAASNEAAKLDWAGIAKLEKGLPRRESAPQRAILLAYVAAHAETSENQQMRRRQLEWLIQNEPTAEVLKTSAALIPKEADPTGYAAIRQVWLDRLKQDPIDRDLMEGAANFLKLSDPGDVRAILGPNSNRMLHAAEWLGEMYGLTAIGARTVHLASGTIETAEAALPNDAMASGARAFLLQETQLPVLLSSFATMNGAARSLNSLSRLPEGYEAFCLQLRGRIESLKPNFSGACQVRSPGLFRVPPDVMKGSLTKQARPQYPQFARDARIQGKVSFDAIIGKNGKIGKLRLISGPLALYEESRNAVSQWEYKPYLVNGQPVEVKTVIDVNYALR